MRIVKENIVKGRLGGDQNAKEVWRRILCFSLFSIIIKIHVPSLCLSCMEFDSKENNWANPGMRKFDFFSF